VTPDVDVRIEAFDAPTAAARNEPFVVLATVENPGNATVTRTVAYEFDATVVAEKPVTVRAGDRQQVAFEVDVAAVEATVGPVENGTTHGHGVVAPGGASARGAVRVVRGTSANASALAVERFRPPDDLRPGDVARGNATVRNVGSVPFEGQVAYRIDGTVVATEWTRVPIGDSRTVTFRVGHAALNRTNRSAAALETTQGVWVGDEALATRPATVYDLTTPTAEPTPAFEPTPTATATDVPTATPATGTETGTATAEPTCERGFFTRCGGTALDSTTLTLIGVFASVLGMLYELIQ
jgi:hypothetical protein